MVDVDEFRHEKRRSKKKRSEMRVWRSKVPRPTFSLTVCLKSMWRVVIDGVVLAF